MSMFGSSYDDPPMVLTDLQTLKNMLKRAKIEFKDCDLGARVVSSTRPWPSSTSLDITLIPC
jgi:hypothetical protein